MACGKSWASQGASGFGRDIRAPRAEFPCQESRLAGVNAAPIGTAQGDALLPIIGTTGRYATMTGELKTFPNPDGTVTQTIRVRPVVRSAAGNPCEPPASQPGHQTR